MGVRLGAGGRGAASLRAEGMGETGWELQAALDLKAEGSKCEGGAEGGREGGREGRTDGDRETGKRGWRHGVREGRGRERVCVPRHIKCALTDIPCDPCASCSTSCLSRSQHLRTPTLHTLPYPPHVFKPDYVPLPSPPLSHPLCTSLPDAHFAQVCMPFPKGKKKKSNAKRTYKSVKRPRNPTDSL